MACPRKPLVLYFGRLSMTKPLVRLSISNAYERSSRSLGQSGSRGRAATGYASLRHFVLAAWAATLRIPHASTCVIPRNEGTCVRNALSVWVLSYRRDDSMGCAFGLVLPTNILAQKTSYLQTHFIKNTLLTLSIINI